MKDGKFLAIGSIVKLEQQDRPIIIVGFLPECEGEAYDYLGYPYPEGFIGDDNSICFTAGLVDQILYWGYETQLNDPPKVVHCSTEAMRNGSVSDFSESLYRKVVN